MEGSREAGEGSWDFLPHQAGPAGLCEAGEKGPVGGKQPPPEPKGLVGSRGLSLDPVEPGCSSPISSIHEAQKLRVMPSQTPAALPCVPCSPGRLWPQSWEEQTTNSLQVTVTEGKPAELGGGG